jgi:endoglucanase
MKSAAVRTVAVVCLMMLSGNARVWGGGWPLWEQYKAHFLTTDGRIVDWSAEERTTSEGEAYALFFALAANDRSSFDRILNWTSEHLAQGSLDQHLPSWLWKRSPAGDWGIADANSASDADLWIAYTLLQAGRIWHAHAYADLGSSLAARIAREEVASLPGNHIVMLPGRQGFQAGPQVAFANPSYTPIQLLTALAKEFPGGPWGRVTDSFFDELSPNVGHGFAMDWVEYHTDSGFAAWLGPAPVGPPSGSYDAIRVCLWAGMLDPHASGRARVLDSLSGMKAYVVAHGSPPERVYADGTVFDPKAPDMCCRRGYTTEAPVGFSAALVPFLLAVDENDAARAQIERMKHECAGSTGLCGQEQRYYDQNLALFSEGWTSGLFRFDAMGQLQLKWKAS